MSTGDATTRYQVGTDCDPDKSSSSSSSSKSVFNRLSFQPMSPQMNVTQPNMILSKRISSTANDKNTEETAVIKSQQLEIDNLRKSINDLYNQLNRLQFVVHSKSPLPVGLSRPNSTQTDIHHIDLHQHCNNFSPISSPYIQNVHVPSAPLAEQPTTLSHHDTSADANQLHHLQTMLSKTKTELEHREFQIKNLQRQNDELLHNPSILGKASTTVQAPLSSQHSHTSAFTPVATSSKPQSTLLPTSAIPYSSMSTPIMPFTMSLTNTLPTFKGKENELPTKFITEFEIRAAGLFGHDDNYLLRAVQQVLSDSALTWFVQMQQEQHIYTWAQFKDLFLRRFKTPEKIELFRNRLRTLWQADNESTADYFERLKALITEIDPQPSMDYIKRKFLQKLRKDIRDKMTLGLTSSLSDIVQKAIEIESNIVQQKIDDKLREAHKEDNLHKPTSTTINNLNNVTPFNSSPLTDNKPQFSNHNNYHSYKRLSKNNNNRHFYSGSKNSRTFFNSARPQQQFNTIQNHSFKPPQRFNSNTSGKTHNTNRWCSFCSSSTHTWFKCYSNPDGPNYQRAHHQHVQQRPHHQSMLSSIYHEQNNNQQHPHPIFNQPEFDHHQQQLYPHPTLNQHELDHQQQQHPHPTFNKPEFDHHQQQHQYYQRPFMPKNMHGTPSTTSQFIPSAPSTTSQFIPSAAPTACQFIPPTSITVDQSANTHDDTYFRSTHINIIPTPASYLTAEAKINDVRGVVLLDTGSGLTIISSRHWSLIGDPSISPTPYNGPDIHGPEGSSIRPVGLVQVKIDIAGTSVQHKAVLAQHFEHLILLGNDLMKIIGLVLDIQANKMWLRSQPDVTYLISSDLTNAGRIDIPLLSIESRTIPSFHMAFIQVKTPEFISSNTWQASITGIRRHVAVANSLVRINNKCCFVQVANCSSKGQVIYPGQHLAVADLYDNDVTHVESFRSSPTSLSSTSRNSGFTSQINDSVLFEESLINQPKSCFTITRSKQSIIHQIPYSHSNSNLFHFSLPPDISSLSCDNSSCISSLCRSMCHSRNNSTNLHFVNNHSTSYDNNLLDTSIFDVQSSTIFSLQSVTSSDPLSFSDANNSSTTLTYNFLADLDLTDTDITLSQIEQLKSILIKYYKCFDDKLGRTSLVQHHIDTGDTKPIKLRPYRVSPYRKEIISNEITKMLHDGIIEPCFGPYAAPITLQPKKDGSLRFCIDYRELNSVTVRDVYPIPRIDDTLDQLQHAKYFTSMDLRSGFWQIELDPASRDKTAFISHAGLFRFRVMPFGLTNAPATFQRLMDLVLGGLKWSCALVYLDDIIVYSSSFNDHLHHLELVLQQIQRSGLTLKINKCHFCKTHLKYLGHIVSKEGIHPDPDKLRAVGEYPVPTKLKAVRTFLGLTSYYRRFIKNYATIAEPLIALTRHSDSNSFQWTSACQDAFQLLRQRLIEAPIIAYPRFDKPFILQLDASDVGLSAILAQKLLDDDNVTREHVIGYASRTLSSAERKYNATERECLAIIYGCNYFRPYLEGTRFTAVTDHKALKWLHSTKDLNTRLARWAIQIAAYDMDIEHRPGSENGPPDALSRYPLDVTDHDDTDSSTISLLSSHLLDTNANDFLSSAPADPGSLLLLDYFRQNSLPPNSLSIPILLPSTSTQPSNSTIANIHFADNINLYEQIRRAQWDDPTLLPVLNFLQHQIIPTTDNLDKFYGLARSHRVIDGALYRVFRSSHLNQGEHLTPPSSSERVLLVIPTFEIPRVMQLAHDHATAAHLGRRKTLSRLTERVYWPHMRRDVTHYVRSCILCQQYKPTNQKPGGLMKPIIVSEPWHTVGIDITGPLPTTRRGNKFILVVVDYFTKWVELFPLQCTKANVIAQLFLDEVICRFGFPIRVISDNGVQFLSKIFIQLCDILGIQHQRTPLYHPQSNLSERINRTLKPLLAIFAHNDSKSWDTTLPQIAFALRTAPSESTDNSPAYLMFGRHPRQPLDLFLPSPTASDSLPSSNDLSAYRKRLIADLLPAYQNARELLDISHQTQTRNYNVNRRSLEFDEGDLVWVTSLSGIAMGKWRGSKMQPRREGPYKIITRLSSVTYELEHIISHKRLSPIHVERLTPYYSYTTIDHDN